MTNSTSAVPLPTRRVMRMKIVIIAVVVVAAMMTASNVVVTTEPMEVLINNE